MRTSVSNRIRAMLLPGLKRWMLVITCGIALIVYGVFLVLGYHPIFVVSKFVKEIMANAAEALPYRISGLIVIFGGFLFVCFAVARVTLNVLGAYLPSGRESIPDVLYRRRHLDSGPRVVVIGGGTGLSNLLKGLKHFTNNISAIVTVGDDGGSSGRLRQELGVLPPGDIRNCITALADEEQLVTELFRYRFGAGEGLEGHSFGNLFLTALCDMTDGDMLEAARVACRVLNSCGQVLPSTLTNVCLVAEMDDGQIIRGESQITHAGGRIRKLTCEPSNPVATPEALEAIKHAELIILGPGSLYTSVVPNLLIQGISDGVRQSSARKIYVCNVMTQAGETTDYSVSDHVQAVLSHATHQTPGQSRVGRLLNAVLINDQTPIVEQDADSLAKYGKALPVRYDPEKLRELGVVPVRRPLVDPHVSVHHDPAKLAKSIMLWYYRKKRQKPPVKPQTNPLNPRERIASASSWFLFCLSVSLIASAFLAFNRL